MKDTMRLRNLIIAGIAALFLFGCAGSVGLGVLGYLFFVPTDAGTQVQIDVIDGPEVGDRRPLGEAAMATPQPSATPQSALEQDPPPRQIEPAIVPTRDLRDLALRLRPDVGEIPLVVSAEAPTYKVGDRRSFWVSNVDTNRHFQIEAELVYKTDAAYAWVEVDQPFDAAQLQQSVDHFNDAIVPTVRSFFGSEWMPGVDADPRMHILHAAELGGSVVGYYSSADQFSKLANPYSNEKEIFYISLNAGTGGEYYETVLAHEFQHMIHWYNDRNEETWVNEGMSNLAQEVAGYPPESYFPELYASRPDTQLNTWSEDPDGRAIHYGNSYLFMAYLLQRFGEEVTQAIVAHPENGVRGIEQALAEAGIDLRFDDVFADWVVANYANEPEALGMSGVYGYEQLAVPELEMEAIYNNYPVPLQEATVDNYAVDYLSLRGRGDVTINFDGQTRTQLASTEPSDGDWMLWSNRGDDANPRLTRRFDLRSVTPGTPIKMRADLWYSIEKDYDYGYVSVSLDGEQWQILPGQRTTTENPVGNSFGAAYNGVSDINADGEADWITEQYDLSAYAGSQIWIRFDYVTDDAVNGSGWFVDQVQISAIDYATSFETGFDGWESEGWVRTDNTVPQEWLIQVIALEDGTLAGVRRVPVDAEGRVTIKVTGLDGNSRAVLAISGRTSVTTEPAHYEYSITR